jgi:hypothetical protein
MVYFPARHFVAQLPGARRSLHGERQAMTDEDYVRTLDELDRLLNDLDVPMQPGLIWRLLDKVSKQDLPGVTMMSRIMASRHDHVHVP